jgi:hypothetical protein
MMAATGQYHLTFAGTGSSAFVDVVIMAIRLFIWLWKNGFTRWVFVFNTCINNNSAYCQFLFSVMANSSAKKFMDRLYILFS